MRWKAIMKKYKLRDDADSRAMIAEFEASFPDALAAHAHLLGDQHELVLDELCKSGQLVDGPKSRLGPEHLYDALLQDTMVRYPLSILGWC